MSPPLSLKSLIRMQILLLTLSSVDIRRSRSVLIFFCRLANFVIYAVGTAAASLSHYQKCDDSEIALTLLLSREIVSIFNF